MWFSCFSVLPGSAEAQVFWGAFWLLTLSVTFLPKKIRIRSHVSKLWQSKGGTFLWDTVYCVITASWQWQQMLAWLYHWSNLRDLWGRYDNWYILVNLFHTYFLFYIYTEQQIFFTFCSHLSILCCLYVKSLATIVGDVNKERMSASEWFLLVGVIALIEFHSMLFIHYSDAAGWGSSIWRHANLG